MRTAIALALAAIAACRSAPPDERAGIGDAVFATASAPLEVHSPREDEPTLAWLVREHARLCGFELALDEAARPELDATAIGLLRSVAVPPAEVTEFVEAILATHGWMYAVGPDVPARLVSLEQRVHAPALPVRAVDPSDLPRYAVHRAVAIETVVPAPPGASQAELAGLAREGSGLVIRLLGTGEAAVLRGPAHDVAELARALAAARASAR